MKGKGIDLEPFGKDEDGWLMFRNSEGDIFRVRESAGKFEIRFDRTGRAASCGASAPADRRADHFPS